MQKILSQCPDPPLFTRCLLNVGWDHCLKITKDKINKKKIFTFRDELRDIMAGRQRENFEDINFNLTTLTEDYP